MKKRTIEEFLSEKKLYSTTCSFVKDCKKTEKIQIKQGRVDKRQSVLWLEEEELTLFFLLLKHSYNSVRNKVWEVQKRMDSGLYITSSDLIKQRNHKFRRRR